VREIFELFVAGYSKTPIARILNERGIPNPTEYKRRKGLRYKQCQKNSTLWKYFSISRLLANEMYIGTMVQNKQRNVSYKCSKSISIPKSEWIKVPNMHEPIIDMELWNKAQALIKQRYKPFGDTNKIGIFAKKVKCIYCGYYMRTSKVREDHYLQCTTKFFKKGSCLGSFVSYKTLEKAILNELNSMIKDMKIEDNDINQKVIFEERLQFNLNSLNQNIIEYNKKIEEATGFVKELYIDKMKAVITDDEFIEFSKEFHEDKEKYQRLIQNAEQEIEQINLKMQTSLNKSELLEKYKDIDHLERIHTDSLIDYIEVGKRIPKTKNREINIYWNF